MTDIIILIFACVIAISASVKVYKENAEMSKRRKTEETWKRVESETDTLKTKIMEASNGAFSEERAYLLAMRRVVVADFDDESGMNTSFRERLKEIFENLGCLMVEAKRKRRTV